MKNVAIGLGLVVVLAGCAETRLNMARENWQSRSPRSYQFEYSDSFVPGGIYLVKVQEGFVTAATEKKTGQPPPADVLSRLPTIEKLLAVIGRGIREASSVSASYDSAGFPTKVDIAWKENMDELEQIVSVSSFRTLP